MENQKETKPKHFKKANDRPEELTKNIKERIHDLWGRVSPTGSITVRCPRCSHQQKATTVKSVNCHNCLRNFMVCPRNKPTRIVQTPDVNRAVLFEIQRLEIDGGRYCNPL
jgi:hypothetical protein